MIPKGQLELILTLSSFFLFLLVIFLKHLYKNVFDFMHMIFEFLLGLIIGILTIPIFLIIAPGPPSVINKKQVLRSGNELSSNQTSIILKSLHVCKDLYWLNILISRFWHEIAESQAQAYRLRSYISKYFEVISNTGIIKNIVVDDVYMDKEAPMIESIRVLTLDECERLLKGYSKGQGKKVSDVKSICENIFKNVNTLLKVNYEGSIRINMRIDLFNNFSFCMDVYIKKIKGDVLMRLPSLDYNTRIDYTFLSSPEIEIAIEAGVSLNEGKAYFKESISKFVRRSVKYAIFRMLVYPSFGTLVLPLIVPTFKKYEHQIEKITTESSKEILANIKDKLSLFLSMDYKIIESVGGITTRRNNYLINEKDKITCSHCVIPENSIPFLNVENTKNYIYEGLTIKESKIMNLIYDLTIFKDVIHSFREVKTVHNFNQTASLIEIYFNNEEPFVFLRMVHKDTIYFQRNDVENPDFMIFRISNKELMIYNFSTTKYFTMTKKRMGRLMRKFEPKTTSTVDSLYKLLKMPKEAYKYFRSTKIENKCPSEYVEDVSSLTIDVEQPDLLNIFEKYTTKPELLKLFKFYLFDSPPEVITKILTDEVRLRLVTEHTKIFRLINEYEQYKSMAVENCDPGGEDFIVHTYRKGNTIMDILNNKKIIFVVERSQPVSKKLSLYRNISVQDVAKEKRPKTINFGSTVEKTCLNIYVEDNLEINPKNYFLESIHTRLKHQEYFDISKKQDFEQVEVTKEIRRDFYGEKGGIYIEFKTQHQDDFRFTLYSSSQKRNILDIQKIITSQPFVMVLPIYESDILSMKLFPKYCRNNYLEMKIVNLPVCFSKESLIDCSIGLSRNQKFIFPTIGSHNYIIFWEKEKDEQVVGMIESPFTRVPIEGNGSFRTDNMKYSIVYKNKGRKKRNIKIFMGSTMN